VEVIPEFLLDAPEQMQDLLRRMWPIAWATTRAACTTR
jgi:phosphonate transport system permease protein